MFIVAGSAIVAGATIYSANMQSNAAKSAANTQARSAAAANQTQWDMFEKQQQNQQPWLKAGTTAVNQLAAGTQQGGQFATTPKFDPSQVNLLQDPGYKFRMQSGADALAAGGSAMGNMGSGNLGVALQKYGQDLGSQEYGSAYGRYLDQYNASMIEQNTMFNRLSGIAGTGQTSANNLMSAGMNTANITGQNTIGAGNALAAGQVGSANAIAGGIQGVSNQLMGGFGAYNQNQMYQNYLNGQQNAAAYGNYGVNPVDYGGGGVAQGTNMYAGDLY